MQDLNDKIELIVEKCVEVNPEIVVNKNAQIIHLDHTVEYFEERRPIRLADILLAMEDKPYFIGTSGDWQRWDDEEGLISCAMKNAWNLRRDNLAEQSEETITFIASLLQ